MCRSALLKSLGVALVFLFVGGCASCEDEGGTSSNPTDEDGGVQDVEEDGNTASDATDAPGDVPRDVSDASDGGDAGGDDECPAYHADCGGECIPVSSDPDNCGGCGVSCGEDEACSGGECVSEEDCMSGQRACDGRCVDTDWDSDHCDECGRSCGDGEACVEGECIDAIELDDPPSECEDGGPQIDFGDATDPEESCSGDLAEKTFRWGLCSCSSVDTNNPLRVDAYDSSQGPYQEGGEGGSVGANDGLQADNEFESTGTAWVQGDEEMRLDGGGTIGGRLLVGGPLTIDEVTTVGRDAHVGGDFDLGASLDIGGTLYTPSEPSDGSLSYDSLVEQAVDVQDPCTECDPDDQVPIDDIVAAAAADNDNEAVGLDEDVIRDTDEPVRLDLPCGNYYLDGIDVDSDVAIVAHGNTALYVDGDIDAENELTITLAEDAQFDVFIRGDVTVGNGLVLGSPNYPALMRTYIGGEGGLNVNNPTRAGAYVYAVPGGIDNNNQTEVFGGIYTGEYEANNRSLIHFDRRVTTVGKDCPEPDDPSDPDGDAGHDAGDGGDDADAGDGGGPSTCQTEGDECSTESDCCSPLECHEGTCELLDCAPLNAECSENDECCSGECGGGVCIDG